MTGDVWDWARRAPDRVAVRDGARTLSFGRLTSLAARVSGRLVEAGVAPGDLVGLYGSRGFEVVVGLLGIWAAGAAFVPLDPAQPAARLRHMVDDSGVRVVVAAGPDPVDLAEPHTLIGVADAVRTGPAHRRPAPDGADLAYAIYTSGSTGRPKGVLVTYDGLASYLHWAREQYRTGDGDGLLHATIAVDLTVTSLLAPLVSGRAVVIAPDGLGARPIAAMLDRLSDFAFLKLTPAHLGLLTESITSRPPASWTGHLVVGGEQLTAEHLAAWRAFAPDSTVVNEYGPTETVVGCCAYRCRAADLPTSGVIPIGQPAQGAELLVLDERLRAVPPGGRGELYIGGTGVARGYHRRAALTAERFVAHPYRPGARVYRSGDVVEVRADGCLVYRGRGDGQVKIAGHRVELSEIEGVLREHPAVCDAVAVWLPDEQELLAYVRLGHPTALAELDEYLVRRLPPYMRPDLVERSEPWPQTASGKLDRQALLVRPR